ncbi:alpha/beta family hydrolase [Novosphingobium sp. Leaf2]|uniref:alpha/beta family hydrolase n=1 Tax=Novosphingobium sp. Leaf2 TaxID=1735670 RepID=UPI0006F6B85E|nr:alpha/beta family hydrolase [Novosphingobium sp. Leaf2]KQM19482.1 hypothetical protein ASE49_04435 [Novosphingobium sp. Leaf2]
MRVLLVAMDQHRYDHIYTALRGQPANTARQLRVMLDTMGGQPVHFVTHSAGGISATMLADHPQVSHIVCFGYPFQHPQHPPQAFRTAHLASVRKPLMILQGDADTYGNDARVFGRHLPPDTRTVTLACDHDYDPLSEQDQDRAFAALAAFLPQSD